MTFQVQITTKYFTAIPEDVIQNIWHFTFPVGSPNSTDWTNLRNRLQTFYNAAHSPTATGQWVPWVNLSIGTFKGYDLADPKPRAPKSSLTFGLTAGTNQVSSASTPPEVAICLSYQADLTSGVPQARRRGRIFLGGWATPTQAGSISSFPNITGALQSQIATAANALRTGVATDNWLWVVHSGTSAGDSIVTNGWVDNAPDTQRRRGQAASSRILWP